VRRVAVSDRGLTAAAAEAAIAAAPTYSEVLAASRPTDWRDTDPNHTLYLDLPAGRVIIELAPTFAPQHVQNIKHLVAEHYYDALPVLRVQDNYVAQWGDPDHRHPTSASTRAVAPEFDRAWSPEIPFTPPADGDVYAPQAGFSNGLPVAGDRSAHRLWLAHCYGMVGVGRDDDPASGSAELCNVPLPVR